MPRRNLSVSPPVKGEYLSRIPSTPNMVSCKSSYARKAEIAVGRSSLLDEDSVHFWQCRLDQLSDRDVTACVSVLSLEDQRRYDHFDHAKSRLHFLAGRALARHALAHYADVSLQSLRFTSNPHGRLEVAWPSQALGLHFNISHTRGFAAVAVCRHARIGIDVEAIELDVDCHEVAPLVFTRGELERFLLSPCPDDHDFVKNRFFDLWTLKESTIKALGLGFSLPPKTFEFASIDETIALRTLPAGRDASWHFRLVSPTPGVRMAVAVDMPFAPCVKRFDWKPD